MRISYASAQALARLIHTSARSQGLTDDHVAARASHQLDAEAGAVEITAAYVRSLRGCPRQPLSGQGRWKLAAVARGLGLDMETVNRLAGGAV